MEDLIIGFTEVQLSTKVLDLTMGSVLDSCDLLFFTITPDLVQVCQELIHKYLWNRASTAISEIMGYFESFFRDPIVFLSLEVF